MTGRHESAGAGVPLLRYYRMLRQYGLNDSHSGNASVREGLEVWLTPTGACADTLREEELLRCQPDSPPPPGASLDAELHLAVYRARPDARAVLHSHGPHSIAMSLADGDFMPVDFEGRYYFPLVPVLDIPPESYTARSPGEVAATLAEHRICIVRGHGVYAAAESLDLAYKWTCSLESSARIAWLARVAGIAIGTAA
jgi:L-fuculose-phosphate aldolase